MTTEPSTGRRQYVGVVFSPLGRVYTYHADGPEEIRVGDRVRVDGREGWQTVEVVSTSNVAPPYETKPIIGKVGKEGA